MFSAKRQFDWTWFTASLVWNQWCERGSRNNWAKERQKSRWQTSTADKISANSQRWIRSASSHWVGGYVTPWATRKYFLYYINCTYFYETLMFIGHQADLCPHVRINSTSCRGFLHKRGSKLNGWSRRWFVFDRVKRTLVYYSDKTEKKPRGGAYFQVIKWTILCMHNYKSVAELLLFINDCL